MWSSFEDSYPPKGANVEILFPDLSVWAAQEAFLPPILNTKDAPVAWRMDAQSPS